MYNLLYKTLNALFKDYTLNKKSIGDRNAIVGTTTDSIFERLKDCNAFGKDFQKISNTK